MGDWQVSAAKWLTHWLDALGALDPNSKSPSVAHFDQFAEVLRDYLADCRTTDESALTSGVRGLLSALRGQLGTARELQRSLALQFEALLGTALPSFETWPAEGERWQQLIARVAVYQAELRALGNLHFDLIDHALAHIERELAVVDEPILVNADKLCVWIARIAGDASRQFVSTAAYHERFGATLGALENLRNDWQRALAEAVGLLVFRALSNFPNRPTSRAA